MIAFIAGTALGLIKLLLLVFAIIMPLMILLELARHYGFLQKAVRSISPVTKRLGYNEDSIYRLLAGIIFGISYGGGVLIGEARTGRIVGRQAFLVAAFLALCHALIEDTLLLVSQGAIWWIVIAVRFSLTVLVVFIIGMILGRSKI
jgi:hypothetical protein